MIYKLFFFCLFVFNTLYSQQLDITTGLNFDGWIVVILLLITLFVLVKEIYPQDVTLLLAGTIPLLFGIITQEQYLSSFANETIITIGMLFVVARAFEKTGFLYSLLKKILPENNPVKKDHLRLLFPLAGLSAFINNTPLVIMMTPYLRKWAIEQEKSPSKYLMPLSYATILGGTLTLIGTSTNLVVSYFLESNYPGLGFSFFEIGKIGIFCVLIGIPFLILFSHRIIPERIDPKIAISTQMPQVLGEFYAQEELNNFTIDQIHDEIFSKTVSIIAIERSGQIITSPSPDYNVMPNDRLVVCGDHKDIEKLDSLKEVVRAEDQKFQLDSTDFHYSESVIPFDSILVGKTLKSIRFRDRFGGSVFAIFREGAPIFANISNQVIKPGDVLMTLTAKPRDEKKTPRSKDLFFINKGQELSYFSSKRVFFVFLVILAMITFATMGYSMMLCSIAAAVVFILSKTVSPRDVVKRINWNLLVLIAGGLSLAKSVEATGVAHQLAKYILLIAGNHVHLLIFVLFVLTAIMTELITNVAAALIILPIALSTVSASQPEMIKAIGITVAIGASCSFLTPIGYQTNTIIYGPGGYKFSDYSRLGIFLTCIVAILVTYLVPFFWPIG